MNTLKNCCIKGPDSLWSINILRLPYLRRQINVLPSVLWPFVHQRSWRNKNRAAGVCRYLSVLLSEVDRGAGGGFIRERKQRGVNKNVDKIGHHLFI